ncbi:MAG: hypothetical protein A2Y07_00765 [Planctomycetes bacterium GWF2_50_10]|nr:MAG: hypothetical protein A2Y07_00765 [Planctomycetes bacterium GWF2_50_10]
MNEKKILIARIFEDFDGGTPSRFGVFKRLDPDRFETICVFLEKLSDEPNELEEAGYNVFYISDSEVRGVFAGIRAVCKLASILKENRVDIIHCHKHKPTVIGTLAAMLADVPVVISQVHGISRTRNWRRKLINMVILKRVAKMIAVGQAVRDDIIATNPCVDPSKVFSEGNSIEYDYYSKPNGSAADAKAAIGLSPSVFAFGTVGRLVPTKGQKFLIEAFATVKKNVPNAVLVIAGDGPLKSALATQAASLYLADSVIFLGKRGDISQVLKAFDAFVMSSISEGIPRAMLEAMASGIPCIGTNGSGIPEIIPDDNFGLKVEPANAAQLAHAMIRIAHLSLEQRQKLVNVGRDRIKNCFSHELVAQKLSQLYSQLHQSPNAVPKKG